MKIVQTFKDFLRDNPSKDIKEKCAPFLRQSGGLPMYRGYGTRILAHAREREVRKDRRPRDSEAQIHDLMNDYFEKKLGTRVRSEALFAIGSARAARAYGHLHYVFPVGEFKFVWGTLDGRPVSDTLHLANRIRDEMKVSYASEAPKIAKQILDSVEWRTTGLEEALESGAEIAILVDRVILVPVDEDAEYEELIK